MIDDGETDWKILAIDLNDRHAKDLNDVEDIDKVSSPSVSSPLHPASECFVGAFTSLLCLRSPVDVSNHHRCTHLLCLQVFTAKTAEVFKFLKYYKVPAGSGPNRFAFDEKPQNKAFAIKVIDETYQQWLNLQSGKVPSKKDGKYDISTCVSLLPAVFSFPSLSEPKCGRIGDVLRKLTPFSNLLPCLQRVHERGQGQDKVPRLDRGRAEECDRLDLQVSVWQTVERPFRCRGVCELKWTWCNCYSISYGDRLESAPSEGTVFGLDHRARGDERKTILAACQ